jgi:hypothetical protein
VVGRRRRRSWAPEQGREREQEGVQRCVSEAFFLLAVRGLVRVFVRGSGERAKGRVESSPLSLLHHRHAAMVSTEHSPVAD